MATKRRKRRKSCKNGKLKRPVRTKKGGKRRCKKSKKKRRRDEKKGEKSQRSRRVLDDDDDEEEEQEEAGPTIVGKDQIDNDVETKDNAPNSSKDYASFFDQFAYKE